MGEHADGQWLPAPTPPARQCTSCGAAQPSTMHQATCMQMGMRQCRCERSERSKQRSNPIPQQRCSESRAAPLHHPTLQPLSPPAVCIPAQQPEALGSLHRHAPCTGTAAAGMCTPTPAGRGRACSRPPAEAGCTQFPASLTRPQAIGGAGSLCGLPKSEPDRRAATAALHGSLRKHQVRNCRAEEVNEPRGDAWRPWTRQPPPWRHRRRGLLGRRCRHCSSATVTPPPASRPLGQPPI